jgi:ADP-heptose:LPS heptosyltransferase
MNIVAKPWTRKDTPRRILAIRLQAMGDVVITLPYLQQLRRSLPPSVRFDLLTRKETEDIPKNIQLFDNVYSIGGGRSHKRQVIDTFRLLPRLWMQDYEMVIDLQNTLISKIVRKTIRPKAWSEFDKYSPLAAGERNRLSIEAAGLGKSGMDTHFELKDTRKALSMLKANGWNEGDKLIVLNPAGFFETRHWPMQNYVDFARLWLQQFPNSRFMVLGTRFVQEKASFLQQAIGDRLINLVGQTRASDAFAILQHATITLSEDSGLMHMSWVSGIPTIALFGSTRSDWSRPLGAHSYFFDSSDLACGNCMAAVCRIGDTRCLTRVSPVMVLQQAMRLVDDCQI